ncbi:hypothetical protein F5Y16DRAFT_402474 [Xylariaceae sp. FL0255]|nr:hypothetical protein F5Y16DRAFT_402474 [Xylariaceae sp. FL0255]
MPPINQLPNGSQRAAAVALIYVLISWICSIIMIWLTWVHRERKSYVAMLAWASCLGTMSSIIQQTHDIVHWREVTEEQFAQRPATGKDGPFVLSNGAFGLDLGLFYIRLTGDGSVQGMCLMFWSGRLAQNIFRLDQWPSLKPVLNKIDKSGPLTAVVLPLVTTLLLLVPTIKKNFLLYIILADLALDLSLAVASLTMITIGIKYIIARRKLTEPEIERQPIEVSFADRTKKKLGDHRPLASLEILLLLSHSRASDSLRNMWQMRH